MDKQYFVYELWSRKFNKRCEDGTATNLSLGNDQYTINDRRAEMVAKQILDNGQELVAKAAALVTTHRGRFIEMVKDGKRFFRRKKFHLASGKKEVIIGSVVFTSVGTAAKDLGVVREHLKRRVDSDDPRFAEIAYF